MTQTEISGISPFFIVSDAPSALAFYRDRLGSSALMSMATLPNGRGSEISSLSIGKYRLALLFNGEELAQRAMWFGPGQSFK